MKLLLIHFRNRPRCSRQNHWRALLHLHRNRSGVLRTQKSNSRHFTKTQIKVALTTYLTCYFILEDALEKKMKLNPEGKN